ncbi:MAG TPA: LytTR family DNA-binding domain-containing protein [Kofleriaceae bacterium]|nr:LytTR family DNA-binding domain-containing protein [Kofleriaceae bacterium]
MTYRVAIADDEPLARRRLRKLLTADPELAVVAECRSGDETAQALASVALDIVFLDVLMPGLDGLSIVERIPPGQRPHVVLVTAHDRYAVRAFDAHAVDYLLKPYDDDRFGLALDRAKAAVRHRSGDALLRALATLAPPRAEPGHLAVRGLHGTTLVAIESIDWIESADNYVQLHLGDEQHLLRTTLTELDHRLPASSFARVHRRAIVNLKRIRELQPIAHGDVRLVLTTGAAIVMSRRYRAALERRLGVEL